MTDRLQLSSIVQKFYKISNIFIIKFLKFEKKCCIMIVYIVKLLQLYLKFYCIG